MNVQMRITTPLLTLTLFLSVNAFANDGYLPHESAKAVESTLVPAPFKPSLKLSPENTHSGYSLPRWVSLKYDTVNGRKGPGRHYPHLWTFQRKGMPVIVVNEMDHWRQIRDIEGGESWVRNVALSGHKTAIVTRTTDLRKSTKANTKILAQMSAHLLVKVKSCHCLLYTSPSPRDLSTSRMPSSA